MKVLKSLTVFTILVFLSQSILFAGEKKYIGRMPEIWSEGDVFYPFLIHPETKALLSEKCVESKTGCQALKAIKRKLKISFTEVQLSGGKNPSSLLCSQGFKGQVLILKDSAGRENSFCRFPDHSIVSANDLRSY